MGQPLPLPEKIPVPSKQDKQSMLDKGFTFGEIEKTQYGDFVTYSMPEKWKFVNNSWREDLPNWEFVAPDNKVYFSVNGSWKGTYDNELYLISLQEPREFEPIKEKSTIPHDTMGFTPIFEALKR